jgi:hypothetical protein
MGVLLVMEHRLLVPEEQQLLTQVQPDSVNHQTFIAIALQEAVILRNIILQQDKGAFNFDQAAKNLTD